MKLKTYETPEVDLVLINMELNICSPTRAGLPDFQFVIINDGDITWD